MRGLTRHGRSQLTAGVSDEAGFSLIELLVAMAVSLIVLGGGVWGMARAFDSSNASTSRVTATSNAEVGLERLVVDLRDAVNANSCTYGGVTLNGPIVVKLAGAVTTIQLCDPNTNLTGTGSAPPNEGVQWICNAGTTGTSPPAQTCVRSVDTGTLAVPAVSTGSRIVGVQTLGIRGVLDPASTTVTSPVYLPCNSSSACTASASATYTLNAGTPVSLSWVGLTVGFGQNASPGSGSTVTVAASQTLTVSTGASLLNFGTS